MKNFTQELKNIMTEDPGIPIMSPDELRARSQTIVILTNSAPDELLALAGPDRKATLLSINPPMITLPYQKGVFKVRPEDIVFENHHTGRDVTEAGGEETPYEKFFASAMKKFGVDSPIELSPDDTKKFFNYVDKNWEAEEESDGSKNEILPALAAIGGGLAGAGMAAGGIAKGIGSAVGGVAKGIGSAIGGDDEDATEDVSTGKVGKKDKGSYQHAYKLALKKYQIHSADELDTPAERKGFTDYVDRLWKKGDIHRDKKEAAVAEADLDEILPALATGAAKVGSAAGRLAAKAGKGVAKKAKKAVSGAQKRAGQMAATRKAEQEKRKAEQEKKKASREKEQAAEKRDREEKAMWKEREREKPDEKPAKKPDEKPAEPVSTPSKPAAAAAAAADDDDKPDKDDKKKKNGFFKGIAGAVKQAADKERAFVQSNASIPEGVKKTPGVSKKAQGAVGFAKHARKGTGAKRQFQKGVRQAGKKQVRNEVSPPDRKHQVKGIKKHMSQKKGKDKIAKTYVDKKTGKRKETNPWALAWAQYDKYGVPSRIEKD